MIAPRALNSVPKPPGAAARKLWLAKVRSRISPDGENTARRGVTGLALVATGVASHRFGSGAKATCQAETQDTYTENSH